MILPLLATAAPHARATMLAEVRRAQARQPFLAAVEIATDPHWHVYWRNPGDSGVPTKIAWRAPKGWRVEPLEWPIPRRFSTGGIAAYGYTGKTLFLARVTPSSSPGALSAKVDWLVCADACIAGGANPSLRIPVGRLTTAPTAARLRAARAALPRPASGWTVAATRGKTVILEARPPAGTVRPAGRAEFFPQESGVVDHGKPALATFKGGRFVFRMGASPFPEKRDRLRGLIVLGNRRGLLVSPALAREKTP